MKNRHIKDIRAIEDNLIRNKYRKEVIKGKVKKCLDHLENNVFEYYAPYFAALFISFMIASVFVYVFIKYIVFITEVFE